MKEEGLMMGEVGAARSPRLRKYADLPRAEGIPVGIGRAYAELQREL